MTNLKTHRIHVVKGIAFLALLLVAGAALVGLTMNWLVAGLLLVVVWAATRAYEFIFLSLSYHLEPEEEYTGLIPMVMALRKRERAEEAKAGAR